MRAIPHPRQSERLAELRRYHVLDTPREQDFDEIVALASKICDAPISVVNLIDADRQWFKAEVGLNARETPLETSLCSHAILEEEFVEISDTLADPRMVDNPLCLADPDGLRFYAGALLISGNGLPIGTLCVLDTRPRSLTDLQREALRVLSRQVMRQLELRRALRDQENLRAEIDHRVKNSLQSVASALRLFASNLDDTASKDAFDAVRRRIDAVGAVHELLQRNAHGSMIYMPDYLTKVAALLMDSAPSGIVVAADVADISLEAEQANAVAMIASEFTANAMKHGFRDGRAGKVDITLSRAEGGSLMLSCRDDGVGSAAASGREDTSLGQRLMQAAASQLGGTLELALSENGAALDLSFPDKGV